MLEELQKTFDKVKLQHFVKPFDRRNGKTIAVLFDGAKRHVGIAECSRKDCYSKKKGRQIALGRALKAAQQNEPNIMLNDSCFTFSVDMPHLESYGVPEYLYVAKEANND